MSSAFTAILKYECKYCFDISRHSKGFETKKETRKWQNKNIKKLCSGSGFNWKKIHRQSLASVSHNPQLILARKLARCLKGKQRCGSGACRICMRELRRWFADQAHQCFDTAQPIYSLCLVPCDEDLQLISGNLSHLNVKKMKERHQTRVIRALKPANLKNLKNVIIVGGFDISFNQETVSSGSRWQDYWQPHWYFVFQGCSSEQLKQALLPHFCTSEKVTKPIRKSKQINNNPEDYARVFSYALKTVFNRRVSYRSTKNGRLETNGRPPLKKLQLTELLLFFDRFPVTDRLFLRGVRCHGTRLVLSAQNARK